MAEVHVHRLAPSLERLIAHNDAAAARARAAVDRHLAERAAESPPAAPPLAQEDRHAEGPRAPR